MKVVVTMAVDVDPSAWAEFCGAELGMGRRAVRVDVKQYVREQVALSAASEEGAITGVVLR